MILAKARPDRRTSALAAGASLIIMAVAAMFSNGIVHGNLVVQGDAAATFDNLVSSQSLFRAGIFGWVVILICDIVAAWAIYVFLKPIHPYLALLGAWLRLTYATILGIAILNLVGALLLAGGSGALSAVPHGQLQAYAALGLEAFHAMWSIGLILFGGHLLIVGILALQSVDIPKIIGNLLWIAAIGYIAIHAGDVFLPRYEAIFAVMEYVFMAPMIAGELGFGLWLLFKGGKPSTKA